MMKANYSRASFVEAVAPRNQKCSCQCGGNIRRGSTCFTRPFITHGRITGHTRIIDFSHYDDWFEHVAHAYAQTVARRQKVG